MKLFLPLLMLATIPAWAGTILSENFDELSTGFAVTSVGAFSTINGTNVDIVGPGNGLSALCPSPAAGSCIDLDGTDGSAQGQLQSNSSFGAGSYVLSFDLIGQGRGGTASATVTFGNYSQTFTLASADTSTGHIVGAAVTVVGSSKLLFVSNTAGNAGLMLDNVTIATLDATTVPEPSSMLLLGSALALGSIVIRFRRA